MPQIFKIAKHDGFDSKAEACCALAVLAIHFPSISSRPFALAGLLEAPAVVSGGKRGLGSIYLPRMTTIANQYIKQNHPEAHQAHQGRVDGRL